MQVAFKDWEQETDDYYYRARFYSPSTGRFLSRDPIGFNSGSYNLYAYAFNSPMSFRDPYGLYSFGEFMEDVDSLITPEVVDFAAGFGSTVSFGLTDKINDYTGANSVVNKCSDSYRYGGYAGTANQLLMGGGLYSTPKTLYHFTSKEGALLIAKEGFKSSKGLWGEGVYATRFNSKILAKLQGARSVEAKVIINNTAGFKPTPFPGTFIRK